MRIGRFIVAEGVVAKMYSKDRLRVTNSPLPKALVMLVTVMTCVCVFASTVCADLGPKPQFDLTVKNAPSEDYFVALISREKAVSVEFQPNPRLSEKENEIVRMIFEYDEDGYKLFENGSMGLGDYYHRSNSGSTYRFFGSRGVLPDSYKILLITFDGEIYVSNEITQKFLHAKCVFDCETGILKENKLAFASFGSWMYEVFICFVITIIIEGMLIALFMLWHRENAKWFFLTNALTQLFLNIMVFLGEYYGTGIISFGTYYLILELSITVIEALVYRKRLRKVDDKVSPALNIFYAIVANAASAFGGYIILRILTIMN